eukprot:TRINITY_DN3398_c0_g3_i1.p1 TRINITY_DN3398_c0_g3~~TRINITY_DN3398_c0_g3_i1.p1  ORF type:complete len:409 (+),score=52.34 TRINITY_DN3398_c0_g3_i1:133-1359(+)
MPRMKPRMLDIQPAAEPDRPETHPGHYPLHVLAARPEHMNAQYAEMVRDRPWGAHRSRCCDMPFGVSGLRASLDETSVLCSDASGAAEDVLVTLTWSGESVIRADPRVGWTDRMKEVMRFRTQGEVRLLDADHCGVEFPGCGVAYLPSCCLNPVGPHPQGPFATADGGAASLLTAGLLVVLRKDAKAIATISPFPWTMAMDGCVNGQTEGVVRSVHRGYSQALCRVQFGGCLWSLPIACLERNSGYVRTDDGVYQSVEGEKGCENPYLSAYVAACERCGCKPNSAFAAQLTHPYVRRLDFRANYLGETGIRCLCEVLHINKSVTEVILADNALDDAAVLPLLDVLRADRIVSTLDLSANALTYTTGRALKQLLLLNPALTAVDVSGTSISAHLQEQIVAQAAHNDQRP